MIGRSAAMQEVFKRIALAAASDISVLLRGESGTGKELAARAIHQHSARADGPLIAVNVAALNPSLAESELFGHVRGAFTGADRDRAGLLVQAHGGTLFLDEVAEIPLGLQVKLLRALDHQEVLPLGGNQPVHSDFRVISATHRDLLADVRRGVFRHDLFFRLCAFELEMPALRHRAEDIPLLVDHFLGRTAGGGASAPAVSREALRELAARPWHGNVRELRNAVEHAVMLARGGTIEPAHFPRPSTVLPPPAGEGSLADALAALVADWAYQKWRGNAAHEDLYQQLLAIVDPPLLAAVLEQHRGNCAAAARTLGMHRITLRKMLDEYGISGR